MKDARFCCMQSDDGAGAVAAAAADFGYTQPIGETIILLYFIKNRCIKFSLKYPKSLNTTKYIKLFLK